MTVVSLMRCRPLWRTSQSALRCLSYRPRVRETLETSASPLALHRQKSPSSTVQSRPLSWSLFGSGNGGEEDAERERKRKEKLEREEEAFSDSTQAAPAMKTEILISPYHKNTIITAERAQHFYLLDQAHLDELQSVLPVRSAYASGDREQMYLLAEVQAKSREVWGSLDNLNEQYRRRQKLLDAEEMRQQMMRVLHHKTTKRKMPNTTKFDIFSHDCRVILYALFGNSLVCALKAGAYLCSGSHSMLAETVHSAFDVVNQSLLLLGYYKSCFSPSYDHPYGHTRQIYVYGLLSGFSLFSIGGLYNIYTGSLAFFQPHGLESLPLAFAILGGSFLIEGATFYQAFRRVQQLSAAADMSIFTYVQHGSESNSIHVLTEDFFSICGVSIAGAALAISHYAGSSAWDAGGMVVIGGLLAIASVSIMRRNQNMLVGKSIQPRTLLGIVRLLEEDRIIRSVHDTKGVVIGANAISFKAEIGLDGLQLSNLVMAQQTEANCYKKALALADSDALRQQVLLRFGTDCTNELGEHIDRIEKAIKAKFPTVRHIDLEIV